MNLRFDAPFIMLTAFLLFALLYAVSRRFRTAFVLNLGPPGGSSFKTPASVAVLLGFVRCAEILGLLLLILAAGDPQRISQEVRYLDRGADIVFVLDISPSMAALDMEGKNRLDAAKELVLEFADRRPSDALGLAVLGSEAAMLIPPTVDRSAFRQRLSMLNIGELGDGTALGMGLAVAALHLQHSQAPLRSLVLITDGENNAGAVHPLSAARLLASMDVSLWVIGVGSFGEVPIEYRDHESGVLRRGVFDSRFDQESLRSIARAGDGRYLYAPSAEAFAQAFSTVDREEALIRRTLSVDRRIPLYMPFLAASLILLCVAVFIRRIVLGALL